MKAFYAFLKKENMELIRSGRLLILLLLFTFFGIMNPAIAKITPWLMETLASSMKESGLIVTEVKVDALTSWTQYYKNISMILIIFTLLISNIFTKERQSGTLILVLTKGLSRFKVILAKTVSVIFLWSVCYGLYFIITYGYTAYFWDNKIASHLFFAAFSYWIFGVWIISLLILFSVLLENNTSVLGAIGGILVILNLASMFSNFKKYLPLKLTEGYSLLTNQSQNKDFFIAILITLVFSLLSIGISILVFNRKKM